jgi:hypothetical protein
LTRTPQIATSATGSPPVGLRLELAQSLTTSHAAVVVGTVIGSGIFLVPTEMMQAVGSANRVFAAWIAGALLAMVLRDDRTATRADGTLAIENLNEFGNRASASSVPPVNSSLLTRLPAPPTGQIAPLSEHR